uniref:Uncharacterized protein n=1 Tax=Anopheles maculatus TaxID=74869 RepID=A0A182SAF8_9DIPT
MKVITGRSFLLRRNSWASTCAALVNGEGIGGCIVRCTKRFKAPGDDEDASYSSNNTTANNRPKQGGHQYANRKAPASSRRRRRHNCQFYRDDSHCSWAHCACATHPPVKFTLYARRQQYCASCRANNQPLHPYQLTTRPAAQHIRLTAYIALAVNSQRPLVLRSRTLRQRPVVASVRNRFSRRHNLAPCKRHRKRLNHCATVPPSAIRRRSSSALSSVTSSCRFDRTTFRRPTTIHSNDGLHHGLCLFQR